MTPLKVGHGGRVLPLRDPTAVLGGGRVTSTKRYTPHPPHASGLAWGPPLRVTRPP